MKQNVIFDLFINAFLNSIIKISFNYKEERKYDKLIFLF